MKTCSWLRANWLANIWTSTVVIRYPLALHISGKRNIIESRSCENIPIILIKGV